jgi:hypothetical protein
LKRKKWFRRRENCFVAGRATKHLLKKASKFSEIDFAGCCGRERGLERNKAAGGLTAAPVSCSAAVAQRQLELADRMSRIA